MTCELRCSQRVGGFALRRRTARNASRALMMMIAAPAAPRQRARDQTATQPASVRRYPAEQAVDDGWPPPIEMFISTLWLSDFFD